MSKIKCAECVYAREDESANEYALKYCKSCERRDDCEICAGCEHYADCKARVNPKLKQGCDRRFYNRCSMQRLKWRAFTCTNFDSEYYRALLNVTYGGDMQKEITWCGCECAKKREVSV